MPSYLGIELALPTPCLPWMVICQGALSPSPVHFTQPHLWWHLLFCRLPLFFPLAASRSCLWNFPSASILPSYLTYSFAGPQKALALKEILRIQRWKSMEDSRFGVVGCSGLKCTLISWLKRTLCFIAPKNKMLNIQGIDKISWAGVELNCLLQLDSVWNYQL